MTLRNKLLVVAVSIVACQGSTWAVEPYDRTPQEEALCSSLVYGGQNPSVKRNAEGDDWIHMHHYCDCIRYRYRALRKISDKPAFTFDLKLGIGGCDYVLTHTSPTFYMRPKVLVDKGRGLRLFGDLGGAIRTFQQAITMNSHEINAYLESAQIQKDLGRSDDALETLYSGLQANPGNKALEQRYRELGGKLRLPEAVAKSSPEAARSSAAAMQSPQLNAERPEVSRKEPQGPSNTVEVGGEEGSASSKGCRYCPPDSVQRKWEDSFK